MNTKLKKFLGALLCAVAVAPLTMGCGGGGGGSTGGGGGSSALTYDLRGFAGTLVGAIAPSATGQSIQVNVLGTVRTVENVIVSQAFADGASVTILSEGSQLLNASVPDASLGANIGTSGFKAPISNTGTLLASVISPPRGIELFTPSATWQGKSLPNGIGIDFFIFSDGDRRIQVNGTVSFPSDVNTVTGTIPVTYTTANILDHSLTFRAADLSLVEVNATATSGTNATVTAPWRCIRTNSSASPFTTAVIEVGL